MRSFRFRVIIAFVVGLAVLGSGCGLAGHYVVSTTGMSPALEVGDHFSTIEIENEILNPIERFDIVVYKSQPTKIKLDTEEEFRLNHRVIGLPNEKIEIKQGKIFINGEIVEEPFQIVPGGIDFPAVVIPDNEYFLLGDNRPNSLDSRYWQKPTIARKDIYGKVNTIIRKADWDNGKRW